MGEVYTEITIKNVKDDILAQAGVIGPDEVRRVTVKAMADTGAWTLVLTENTCKKLGLKPIGASAVTVAGGDEKDCLETEAVEVIWKDRSTVCRPLVLSGEDDEILGAIPMEGMDLIVCPKRREVIGAHGDKPVYFVK
ncbi:MAG: hypothetical protein LBR23_03600 [Spirochaetaceae bacterium]|jgi:hypothetical protein|nr:hypothetical protein [Spirochaetaceae bacterium]